MATRKTPSPTSETVIPVHRRRKSRSRSGSIMRRPRRPLVPNLPRESLDTASPLLAGAPEEADRCFRPHPETLGEALQRQDQARDLLVGVRRGELEPKPDLMLRNERVDGHGRVDALVEQVAADLVDVVRAQERDLDDGVAGVVRRGDAELGEALEHPAGYLMHAIPKLIPPLPVDPEPLKRRCQ